MSKNLRKIVRSSTATLLGVSALIAASTTALATEQAGVSAAVRGSVQLSEVEHDGERDLSVGDAFAGGEDVFLGDTIESAFDSGMQVMLLDETTFTIGPESDLTIDEFAYDPATGAGELSAEATKGIFRFVSGSVTQNNPDGTDIDIGSGTMGVRGTMALVSFGEREGILVVNLGPGSAKENSNDKVGKIDVEGSKNLSRLLGSGMSAFLRPDGSVSEPFEISQARLAKLITKLDQGSGAGTFRPGTFGGRSLRGGTGGSGPIRQSFQEGHGDGSFVETDYSPDDFVDIYLNGIEDLIDDHAFEEYWEEYYYGDY